MMCCYLDVHFQGQSVKVPLLQCCAKILPLTQFQYRYTVEQMSKCLYVTRDLVGNNNSSTANCISYLTKKSNQPEDGT